MSNSIDVHIKNLRRKINDSRGKSIRTVRGVGYMIKEDGDWKSGVVFSNFERKILFTAGQW